MKCTHEKILCDLAVKKIRDEWINKLGGVVDDCTALELATTNFEKTLAENGTSFYDIWVGSGELSMCLTLLLILMTQVPLICQQFTMSNQPLETL